MSGLAAIAVNKIGTYMMPFKEERDRQTRAQVQYEAALTGTKIPPLRLRELESIKKTNANPRGIVKMLPKLTRRCLVQMDKGLKGRGYSNVHGTWQKGGSNKKQTSRGTKKTRTAVSGSSSQVQDHHAVRLVRTLLLAGAARTIPGLALLCAFLELAFEKEQVESIDQHFQGFFLLL